jgi:DNA-binding NarL/FixJ family response regulator
MSLLRVLLADDHALVRAGLRALLEAMPGIEVVGEASDGHDALRLMSDLHPDVALVDIGMPTLNGLETTVRAAREFPHTRVLILSMHADEEYVRRALVIGASGYILKNADKAELELAVRAVARGQIWLRPFRGAYASAASNASAHC